MAVPRNRMSNSRRKMRRSHHALKPKTLLKCLNCAAEKLPHRACSSCGFYRGRQLPIKQTEQA